MKRQLVSLCGLVGLVALAWMPGHSQEFSYNVERHRWLRDSTGLLRIDQAGIAYEPGREEDARRWSFQDIRHVEIVSATQIVLHTYGEPDRYDFRLRQGELEETVYRLLAALVPRGVTSRVLFSATQFVYELPVKHEHRFGGCEGILRVSDDLLIFETDNAEDRRMWRMQDIRSFGAGGPYNLRLATELETFNFDLKRPLPREAYDFLWEKVYGMNRMITHS